MLCYLNVGLFESYVGLFLSKYGLLEYSWAVWVGYRIDVHLQSVVIGLVVMLSKKDPVRFVCELCMCERVCVCVSMRVRLI